MPTIINAVWTHIDSNNKNVSEAVLDQDVIPGQVHFEYLESKDKIKISFLDSDIGNEVRINNGHLVFNVPNTKSNLDSIKQLFSAFQNGGIEQANVKFNFLSKDKKLIPYNIHISFYRGGNCCVTVLLKPTEPYLEVMLPFSNFLDNIMENFTV